MTEQGALYGLTTASGPVFAIVTGLLVGVYAGLILLATRALPLRGPVASRDRR